MLLALQLVDLKKNFQRKGINKKNYKRNQTHQR